MKNLKKIMAISLSLALLSLPLAGCEKTESGKFETLKISESFASYKLETKEIKAQVPDYKVKADLSNVVGIDRYNIAESVREKLATNAFVVLNNEYNDLEFFDTYEGNRYEKIPSFVTVDSLLHSFHLQFDYILKTAEIEKLNDELIAMTDNMLEASRKDAQDLKGTDWENASIKNLAFFGVAKELLGKDAKLTGEAAKRVEEELKLIEAKQPMQVSPIMSIGEREMQYEDYTQYQVRGHYTDKEHPELQTYFKAMMWYGRMPFLFKNEVSMQSAALLSKNLCKKEISRDWLDIYETTAFFAGDADSVTPIEASLALKEAYGGDVSTKAFKESKDAFKNFVSELKKLDKSRIETNPHIYKEDKKENKAETAGLKFMGQRYSIDADVFQNLIFSKVKENSKKELRTLPKLLDVPAAFGSELAVDLLENDGDFEFKNYKENLNKMQEEIQNIKDKIWQSNLYWAWLYNLRPILEEHGKGYPAFMQNKEWNLKNLNTFAGSYTELKHDTILYSASAMAEKGGAGEMVFDDRGYVEPVPEVYARMEALSKMMIEGLEKREMLSKGSKKSLEVLNKMAARFQKMAELELQNKPLSEDDYDFIREYGGNLEHLWYSRFTDGNQKMLDEDPAMVIADVASDPDGNILEIGVGEVRQMLVVFPIDGELHLGVGSVYSTHEFVLNGERYTDDMWRKKFRTERENKPKDRAWTKGYTVNTSYYDQTNFYVKYEDEY